MKWMGVAAAFVALQLFVAATLALSIGFYEPPPFMKYAWTAAFPVLFYLGGSAVWRMRALPEQPTKYLLAQDWRPHAWFAAAMALVWLQFVSLTWMKAMLPVATSMWADPALADIERALLGSDAWRLLPGPNPVLDYLYGLWPLALCAAFVGCYFQKREPALLAFFLTVGLLGTFGQYLLPSGGPIFWERMGYGGRFAAMDITITVERTSSYLWAAYRGNAMDFATGISAFPSIHVATATWIAIAYRHMLAHLYLAAIFFGSIILGWHYALDSVAGVIGALLCYSLARKILTLKFPSLQPARNQSS